MNIETLFQTVLRNSENVTRAIEATKVAVESMTESNKQVVAVLQQNSQTNLGQTQAITTFINEKTKLEKDKEDIDTRYQKQIDDIKLQAQKERQTLMKYIIILAALLFIAIGGASLLKVAKGLGIL